jgi:hypothetical protein
VVLYAIGIFICLLGATVRRTWTGDIGLDSLIRFDLVAFALLLLVLWIR